MNELFSNVLFYASTPAADQWAGPFANITTLLAAAYADRPEDDGVYVASGRAATDEEREMHDCPYTIETKSPPARFISWPAWIRNAASACAAKVRYPKKKIAQAAINEAMRRRRNRPRALRAYSCPHCNGWHITKHVDLEE